MAQKIQISKSDMEKLHNGEEVTIGDYTLSFQVKEGTCGYNVNVSTNEKLTTPGGLEEEKIEVDSDITFELPLSHLLDKHVVKENIQSILEKKAKRDRCLRIADRKFDKPSAYKSGAVVRCRKGDIWKGLKEEQQSIVQEKAKETLRTWFNRAGAPGKTGGWVDCNAPIRKDGKITGYKSCGRQKGEKRSYPACRPTPSQCKDKGKGKSWGKKAAGK
jgi:hypothetical protein